MQAEASVALIATCRKEWIERFAPDLETHAAAIVGKKEFRHRHFRTLEP